MAQVDFNIGHKDYTLACQEGEERLLKRAAVEGRADDTEDVIRERMAIYHRETAPLAEVYAGRGLLVQVDGLGEVDEVCDRIGATLDARQH